MTPFYLGFGGLVFLYFYWISSERLKRLLIALGNALFLVAFGLHFFALHLVSALLNYTIARSLPNSARLRTLIVFAVLSNLGLIFYYKFQVALQSDFLMPLGVSYYTMVHLGYVLDVSRGQVRPYQRFFDFYLFSGFFPTILMGPIERATTLGPELDRPKHWNWNRFSEGVFLISLGIFKKAVIADRLHSLAYSPNGHMNQFQGLELWLFFILCLMQIYCDFSSYIDMVRGFAKLMGIHLSENFRQPYLAKTVPEIWQRWNMTLVSFLRNHLFFPILLKTKNMYISTLAVMIAIGLWHRLSWLLVLWSFYWTLLYWLHIALRNRGIRVSIYTPLKSVSMILAMAFSTVFLVSQSHTDLILGIKGAFLPKFDVSRLLAHPAISQYELSLVVIAVVAMVGLETMHLRIFPDGPSTNAQKLVLSALVGGAAMVVLALLFGVSESQAFIYMRF